MSSSSESFTKIKYVKLDEVKTFLGFETNEHNSELEQLIEDANQEINMRLRPFADSLPLNANHTIQDEEFLNQARKTGVYYVVSCYEDIHNNHELADRLMKKFESKMKVLIDGLKSVPTNRTKAVLISSDPRDKKTILPTQASIFAFDDF